MAPAKKAAKKAPAKKSTKKTAKKAPAKKTAKKTAKKGAKKTAKKGAKKTAKRSAASSSTENVVVASKLRDAIRGQDIRMAGDFPEALNAEVHELVERAVRRAKGNNRGTVRPTDL